MTLTPHSSLGKLFVQDNQLKVVEGDQIRQCCQKVFVEVVYFTSPTGLPESSGKVDEHGTADRSGSSLDLGIGTGEGDA